MDISKGIKTKLSFDSGVYQQLSQRLSELDTFKGSWKVKETQQGQYLKELRKIATIESTGSSTRIEGARLTDREVILENYDDIELSDLSSSYSGGNATTD